MDFVEWSKVALERLAERQKSKWVQLENGIRAPKSSMPGTYRYAFDKPGDEYLPVDIAIKYRPNRRTKPKDAVIVFASETQIEIELPDDLGESVLRIEVNADARNLLYKLSDRLSESGDPGPIALKLALGKKEDFQNLGIPPNERDVIDVALTQDLTFVWGPPGTGKTYQLSRLAEELVNRGLRILMVSGANVAVDEAAMRVCDRLHGHELGTVLRYGNPRAMELDDRMIASRALARANKRDLFEREQALLKARNTAILQKQLEYESELKSVRRKLRDAEIELVRNSRFLATTLARASVDPVIFSQHFDVVFYDEVGMALVPQVVFAGMLAKRSMCCFGDFRQLPPIVDDGVPELKQDIFGRLGITESIDENGSHDLLVMLSEQWRCHPDIASFVSTQLYGGLLTTNVATAEETSCRCKECLSDRGAMCLVDISGMPALGLKDSSSHFNLLSASICVALAKGMPKDWGIAIITPYKSQAQITRGMIRDVFGKTKRVRSATVHSFQGSESEAVIFDVVDCAPRDSLGLLLRDMNERASDRLMNVAITRAKFKFIMVANVLGMRSIYPQTGLLIRDFLDLMLDTGRRIYGRDVIGLMPSGSQHKEYQFFESGLDPSAWDTFTHDVDAAQKSVIILMSRTLTGTPEQINRLCIALENAARKGALVEVYGRASRDLPPFSWRHLRDVGALPNTAMSIVDDEILWNGLPCSWLKDYNGTRLTHDPVFRISGGHAAKEVSRIYRKKIEHLVEAASSRSAQVSGNQLSFDFGL